MKRKRLGVLLAMPSLLSSDRAKVAAVTVPGLMARPMIAQESVLLKPWEIVTEEAPGAVPPAPLGYVAADRFHRSVPPVMLVKFLLVVPAPATESTISPLADPTVTLADALLPDAVVAGVR
jgi:hypothetical protein